MSEKRIPKSATKQVQAKYTCGQHDTAPSTKGRLKQRSETPCQSQGHMRRGAGADDVPYLMGMLSCSTGHPGVSQSYDNHT